MSPTHTFPSVGMLRQVGAAHSVASDEGPQMRHFQRWHCIAMNVDKCVMKGDSISVVLGW